MKKGPSGVKDIKKALVDIGVDYMVSARSRKSL